MAHQAKPHAMLEITDVKIYPFDLRGIGGNVRAYAEVTFNEVLTLRGLRVIETPAGGLFISYPSQKSGAGEFRDLIVPHTKETKAMIRQAILERYRASRGDSAGAPQETSEPTNLEPPETDEATPE